MVNTKFMIVITVGGMEGSRIGEGNQKDLKCIQLSLSIHGGLVIGVPHGCRVPIVDVSCCFFFNLKQIRQ